MFEDVHDFAAASRASVQLVPHCPALHSPELRVGTSTWDEEGIPLMTDCLAGRGCAPPLRTGIVLL